jgi:hypothetical protein
MAGIDGSLGEIREGHLAQLERLLGGHRRAS